VYEGENANYFVTVSLPKGFGGGIVYANYRETVTTLSSADGTVLVEGLFDKETTVEVTPLGNYYTLRFMLNGEEVVYTQATVKIYVGKEVAESGVYTVNGAEESVLSADVVGEYLRFSWQEGVYFRVGSVKDGSFPAWGWALIGGVSGMAVLAVLYLIVRVAHKKKSK
jgi:hypothetical protein